MLKNISLDDVEGFGPRDRLFLNSFFVEWTLGLFCNYACSYCWPGAHSNIKDHIPTDVLLKGFDKLIDKVKQKNLDAFFINFTGGEPTLHKGFLQLVEHFSSKSELNIKTTGMTSNLSQGKKWLEKYIKVSSNLDRVYVSGSWHSEFGKKEDFLEKAIMLQEAEIYVNINIVMMPSRFYELLDHAKYFYDGGINVVLKPLRPMTDGQYTEEMLNILSSAFPKQKRLQYKKLPDIVPDYFHAKNQIKTAGSEHILVADSEKSIYIDSVERFNSVNFNKFKGWDCAAGHTSIKIMPNGDVHRGVKCIDKKLGNITTDFELYTEVKPCISSICDCATDLLIPKRRKGTKFPLYPDDASSENKDVQS